MELPNELLHHIFTFVTLYDLSAISRTCKRFQKIVNDPHYRQKIRDTICLKLNQGNLVVDRELGVFHGFFTHTTSEKISFGTYRYGVYHGLYISTYQNRVIEKGHYIRGIKQGSWFELIYNEDNEEDGLYTFGPYKNGIKQCRWYYGYNGRTVVIDYENNLPHGKCLVFSEQLSPYLEITSVDQLTGVIWSTGQYHQGRKTGVWKTFDESGKELLTIKSYENDALNGYCHYNIDLYYEVSGCMKNDVMVGVWVEKTFHSPEIRLFYPQEHADSLTVRLHQNHIYINEYADNVVDIIQQFLNI